MTTRVCRFTDVPAFIRAAAPWLLRSEPEHSLILGLLTQLQRDEVSLTEPAYMATVEVDGAVAGCALRSPPHQMLVTRMPERVIPALVADVAACYQVLPSVLGPEPQAREFGRHWGMRRQATAVAGVRHRLYVLRELRQTAGAAPGVLMLATATDEPLVASWIEQSAGEAGMQRIDAKRHAANRIAVGDIALWWNDGAVCSMAGVSGRSRSGSRLGYVYTPPARRGRGYATSCVTELTRRELGMGASFCCLYADMSNHTSNAIYQQVGYEPVCDFADIVFRSG
jgi:uncharacterized protein